jgi:hypothetical protein
MFSNITVVVMVENFYIWDLQDEGFSSTIYWSYNLVFLFQSSEAGSVSQAYHCYALNYINALNYLETLRRHVEFCEFEKVRNLFSINMQKEIGG